MVIKWKILVKSAHGKCDRKNVEGVKANKKKPQALDWNHLTLEPFCGFISLTHTRMFDEQAEKSDCK